MIISRDYNPWTGIETTYERDSTNPRLLHIHQRQRCDDTLRAAEKLRGLGGVEGPVGRMMGIIPPGLAMQWGQEVGINPFRLAGRERLNFFKRKLQDPDYKKLRVTEGSF